MAWVVDTCLLIDVAEDDAQFGAMSAELLDAKARDQLTISPITYIELGPVFEGDAPLLHEYLEGVGVDWTQAWTRVDTEHAHQAWWGYVLKRRSRRIAKRPVADILIGAFAQRFQGLLTRNARDFHRHFPDLLIEQPETPTRGR